MTKTILAAAIAVAVSAVAETNVVLFATSKPETDYLLTLVDSAGTTKTNAAAKIQSLPVLSFEAKEVEGFDLTTYNLYSTPSLTNEWKRRESLFADGSDVFFIVAEPERSEFFVVERVSYLVLKVYDETTAPTNAAGEALLPPWSPPPPPLDDGQTWEDWTNSAEANP